MLADERFYLAGQRCPTVSMAQLLHPFAQSAGLLVIVKVYDGIGNSRWVDVGDVPGLAVRHYLG